MEKRWIWPFELEEQIGAGAMGVVYRARFVKNDRRVALKLLPQDVAANATLAARFQREMELLKDLRHPHIVHCFGGTCEGDQWFYAMELVEGGTLASLIDEQGRLPWRETIEFGLQVCAALEHAHQRQVIHRDLKPGNLLITKTGKLKLSDFGLAQVMSETKLTAAGKTVGSLHYMAPEQIQGKPPLSNRTDLYAFGCVLFEMLTGRPPFLGGAVAEILQRHIRETPPPVGSVALDCPPQLEALVAELLAKDPSRRPQDAQTVAVRLREIDQGVTIKMPRFDRNRPVPKAVATATLSSEIPVAPRGINPALVAGLMIVGIGIGWLLSSLTSLPATSKRSDEQWVAGLRDPNPQVRIFAAKALAEIGPEATATSPALIEHTTDPDPLVRVEIMRALGKVGVGSDPILALMKVQREDDNSFVRDAAVEAQDLIRNRPTGRGSTFWIVAVAIMGLAVGGGVWGWKKLSK